MENGKVAGGGRVAGGRGGYGVNGSIGQLVGPMLLRVAQVVKRSGQYRQLVALGPPLFLVLKMVVIGAEGRLFQNAILKWPNFSWPGG